MPGRSADADEVMDCDDMSLHEAQFEEEEQTVTMHVSEHEERFLTEDEDEEENFTNNSQTTRGKQQLIAKSHQPQTNEVLEIGRDENGEVNFNPESRHFLNMKQLSNMLVGKNAMEGQDQLLNKFQEMIMKSQQETASLVQKQLDQHRKELEKGETGASSYSIARPLYLKNSPPKAGSSGSSNMVYTNAVKDATHAGVERHPIINLHEINSSSEEKSPAVDTSEEMDTEVAQPCNLHNNDNVENVIMEFIAANRPQVQTTRPKEMPRPSTSRGIEGQGYQAMEKHDQRQKYLSPEEKAQKMVRDAEAARAQIIDAPGENINVPMSMAHSFLADENFLLVASHLDQATYDKIVQGDYVDFTRLIPKDKVLMEDDQRMQIINKAGQTFWVPATQAEVSSINSFGKWEQAFRVFSDVYTRAYPHRAAELVQYNHVIHTASIAYSWDNVYIYDKDFRLHMSRHQNRPWSLILQQSWSLRLKDKLRGETTSSGGNNKYGNNSANDESPHNRYCKRFNRGRCSYGTSCRYEHRCYYCGKFRYGVINCWQLKFDRNDRNRSRDYRDHHDRDDDYHKKKERNMHGGHQYSHTKGGTSSKSDDKK